MLKPGCGDAPEKLLLFTPVGLKWVHKEGRAN